jgi:hypothetical protein
LSVDPTFEVIRFQVAPAGGAVAVIELEGRPADSQALSGRPVLLLEGPVEQAELQAIVEPDGVADGVLRATFAAPLELAVDTATTFALAIGRGPLLELPPPHGVGEAGLEVRLARTVNALRTDLHQARHRLGTEVRDKLAERDERAARELAAEREGATAAREAAERAAEAEREATAAAAAERSSLEAELAEARDEAQELREELINAQARIDALEASAAAHKVPRTQRHPPPRRQHTRSIRAPEEDTERHEHVARHDHSSLGRSTVRAVVLVLLALLLAALVVLVLQVRVV